MNDISNKALVILVTTAIIISLWGIVLTGTKTTTGAATAVTGTSSLVAAIIAGITIIAGIVLIILNRKK